MLSSVPLRNRTLGILYYVVVALGAVIFAPVYGIVFCNFFRDVKKLNNVAHLFFVPIFKIFGIRLRVDGLENIPRGRGFVIIANHQSFLDINCIFAGVAPSAFLAKEDLWKIPLFRKMLDISGSIPVHRGASRGNVAIGARLKERTDKGYVFSVFPEGSRSENGALLPFKNGIFHMAKEHRYTLLPITILNTGRILPKSATALFPGELKIIIHPPVEPSTYETMTFESLRDQVRATILSALPAGAKAKEA